MKTAEKTVATGLVKSHPPECAKMAEWLMGFQAEPWDMLRHASNYATYFTPGAPGLGQFVFRDGTMLVSHNWGQNAFAVDPSCSASWEDYVARMTEMGLAGYLLSPTARVPQPAKVVSVQVVEETDTPDATEDTMHEASSAGYGRMPETVYLTGSATVH